MAEPIIRYRTSEERISVLETKQAILIDKLDEHIRREEESRAMIIKSLNAINEQISIYKTMIKVTKAIGLIIVALMTLKFGDITKVWHDFFN